MQPETRGSSGNVDEQTYVSGTYRQDNGFLSTTGTSFTGTRLESVHGASKPSVDCQVHGCLWLMSSHVDDKDELDIPEIAACEKDGKAGTKELSLGMIRVLRIDLALPWGYQHQVFCSDQSSRRKTRDVVLPTAKQTSTISSYQSQSDTKLFSNGGKPVADMLSPAMPHVK